MTLRQILTTMAGVRAGVDYLGNLVLNRKDGSQIVLDANATTGVPSVYTQTAAGVAAQYDMLTSAQAAAVVAGVPARVSGMALVSAFGDSIIQDGYSLATGLATYQPHGFMTWAMGFSMGALWCPFVATPNSATALLNYNRGVSGETASQTAARVTELDALPVKPRFCIILTGTNDLNPTTAPSATTVASTITGICDSVLSRGITPVLCTLLPRGNGTSSGSSNGWSALSTVTQVKTAKGILLEINRQLRGYASITPGVILADTFFSILDYSTTWSDPVSTYTGRTSATPDYLHPNVPGAVQVGKVVWNAIAPFVAPAVRSASGTGDGWDATFNPYGSMFDSSFSTNGGSAGTGVSAAAAWVTLTAYVVNDVVTSGGFSYRCVVAGTTGATSPTFTAGQGLDGTVVWEVLSLTALGGVPSLLTANRVLGAAATATILTQKRADGLLGNEEVFSMYSAENAQFRSYLTSTGSAFSNANWSLGDVLYAEIEVSWNCGAGGYYCAPDIMLRWAGSAYSGTYTVSAALPNATIATHVQGAYTALLRTPLIDSGLTTALTGNNFWTLCGARSSGSGRVLSTIRNVTVKKYNKTAPGAITWTAAA